ncbi:hypothetical protein ACFO5Q_16455 [Kordiimonas lipolytica]|uniref:Uncharacterized protein n=1 Tax=Kordiimonas lipolytica TaxID=1662421 RepID=A0ABV8UDY0_9PROT|nr:hypothetical protein [Kordiimonas lipolytica]
MKGFFTSAILIGWPLANVLYFVNLGLEAAAISPEQAIGAGVAPAVYSGLIYTKASMAFCWAVIGWSAWKGNKLSCLSSSWLFVGLFTSDFAISHRMAIEANDPLFLPVAVSLAILDTWYLIWAVRNSYPKGPMTWRES